MSNPATTSRFKPASGVRRPASGSSSLSRSPVPGTLPPASLRQRRRSKLRRLFWKQLVGWGFMLLAGIALWQFWYAPWWYVQRVEIRTASPELKRSIEKALLVTSGVGRRTSDERASSSGVRSSDPPTISDVRSPDGLIGRHLLLVHPGQIRLALEHLSPIRSVTVTRRLFPARLIVDAGERLPLARLQVTSGVGRRTSEEGPLSSDVRSSDLPTDLGVDEEGVTLPFTPRMLAATPLRFRVRRVPLVPEQRTVIRQVVAAWRVTPLSGLGNIDVSEPQRIWVQYRGARWLLGDCTRLPQKLSLLPHLRPLAARYGGALEYVNVSDPQNPVLKMLTPPAPSPSPDPGSPRG